MCVKIYINCKTIANVVTVVIIRLHKLNVLLQTQASQFRNDEKWLWTWTCWLMTNLFVSSIYEPMWLKLIVYSTIIEYLNMVKCIFECISHLLCCGFLFLYSSELQFRWNYFISLYIILIVFIDCNVFIYKVFDCTEISTILLLYYSAAVRYAICTISAGYRLL